MCGLLGRLAPTEYDLGLGCFEYAGPGLWGLRAWFVLFPVTALVDGDLRPTGAVVVDTLIALLPLRPFFVGLFIGDGCVR